MGGRGSSSGVSVKYMTEEQYVNSRASVLSDYMTDKIRIPHGETLRQKKKREKEAMQSIAENAKKREEARIEYRELVKKGKIKTPSNIMRLQQVARGHSDNESVQAARRSLKKRGYSW